MNSIFSLNAAENGIGAWKEYFNECCEVDNLKQSINLEDLIVTATEANGNFTFYRINRCNNFVDWVEEIANQWLI